jgi:dihydrofolate synthase/folylpolyglutamate synthase
MDALSGGDPAGRPTYFEVVTALAFLRFALHEVGAAVIEVGMGGRLDSTNVCRPLVSVITTISFDHTQQLGNTLAAIAGEKAGIIKPGVPVICGVLADEPRQVIEEVARRNECRVIQLGRDFDYRCHPPRHLEVAPANARMDFFSRAAAAETTNGPAQKSFELSLIGRHQAANGAVALAIIDELSRQGFEIPQAAIAQGLREVRWPARIEVLQRRPTIVLDAAHNVASAEALAEVLAESFSAPRRLLVFGTTRDKNYQGMLAALLPCFDEVILTRYWSNPRGVPPEDLEAVVAELSDIPRHACPDPASAWRLAASLATPEHLICIAGSFFIAAEMRAAISGKQEKGREAN